MSESANQVLSAVLALSAADQESIFHRPGETLWAEDESDEADIAEIDRRVRAAEIGEEAGIPNDIVFDPNRPRLP